MPTLSRYTSIPAMLDTLVNKRLVLVDPNAWSDRNDREVMQLFAQAHPDKQVFAACMAEGKETAHHWQVFADRGNGACIRFDKDRLLEAIQSTDVHHGSVSYVGWREFSPKLARLDRLPFLKRGVFRFEREYRVVAVVDRSAEPVHIMALPIPISAITSVWISGELPNTLFATMASLIKSIPGCETLRVRQSGLMENVNWSRSIARLLNT